MEKPILHVVSLSGGKDSTAMLLRMVEEGWPIDHSISRRPIRQYLILGVCCLKNNTMELMA